MSANRPSRSAGLRAVKPDTLQGLTRSALLRGVNEGRWERIARGIYLPSDAPPMDWDQLEASTRRPDATICLISALAHYDLTDEVPDALDVAIPRGARTPQTQGAIRWHHFDKETFDLGREEITIPGSSRRLASIAPSERLLIASVYARPLAMRLPGTRPKNGCAAAANQPS